MSEFGFFSGNPKTEWLVSSSGEDREMRMLEDFSFTDKNGRVWLARTGTIVNGASIPQSLWSTIGSPYTDDYRRASIVHDVACETPGVARIDADHMFHDACRAGGCSARKARILYAGVRIGAWVSFSFPASPTEWSHLSGEWPLRESPSVESAFLQAKFLEIARDLEQVPDGASCKELDNVIGIHLSIH
jgi:hypothetical protein